MKLRDHSNLALSVRDLHYFKVWRRVGRAWTTSHAKTSRGDACLVSRMRRSAISSSEQPSTFDLFNDSSTPTLPTLPQIDESSNALPSSLGEKHITQDTDLPNFAPNLKAESERDVKMEAASSTHQDTDMMDAPQPTSMENSRDREEDKDTDERSSKRAKITEDDTAAQSTTNGVAAPSITSHPASEPSQEPPDMMDAPQPTSMENSRDREEDKDTDERSSKRANIIEDGTTAQSTINGVAAPSVTSHQASEPSQEPPDMMDTPQLTSMKNSRDREEDEDAADERSSKRAKITEDGTAAQSTTNGVAVTSAISHQAPEPSQEPPRQITKFLEKELIKHLKNAARTTDGKHFKEPVAVLWPAFAESYAAKIDKPIDFQTIETKLRGGSYSSMNAVRDDIRLLRANAIAFNGVDNPIAQSAVRATKAVLEKIESIPLDPPFVARVIQKKPKAHTPASDAAARAPTARRHSKGGGPSFDTAPAPAPTYALNPQSNTPLIRRDSTKDDGRPKRDIHPPKNKDLPYTTRPKSKKHAPEFNWCQEVMNEIQKSKYLDFVYPFKEPVDPVAQGIPTYFNVVRTPMDLSTVQKKLNDGHYTTSKDFEKDINQIYINCYKFNPPGNLINDCGKKLEALWKDQLSKKARWMSDHAPTTAIASVSPTPDYEEEASDDEQAQQAPTTTNTGNAATLRLVEEQQKLIDLITSSDTDPGQLEMQKQLCAFLKSQVASETTTPAASTQNVKKSKKAKTAAPRAPPAVQQQNRKKAAAAVPPKKPSHSSHKAGPKKEKYMGTIEKEVISAGIASLPDAVSAQVLKLIQDGQPDIDEGDDGTVELDIDAIPTGTLWKIYDLIKLHTPEVERDLRKQFQERDAPRASTKQAPKKKNKPMNKFEQDRKIELLKNSVQTFERGDSQSQEPPLPSVEDHGNDQSDDRGNVSSGDDASDSEEE